MESILIMLSGGLDSVYMLYHYLTETEHPIHAHHISVRYPQLKRWIMEDPAARKVVDYCRRQYRDFDFSESRFDMDKLNEVGMDSDLHLLVAAKLAPNVLGDTVTLALGHLYDDDPLVPGPHRVDKVWWALRDRIRRKDRVNSEIAKPLLGKQITKHDVCRKLPDELLRLCWSCRMPDYSTGSGGPCGWCDTCKRIEKSFRELGRTTAFPNLVRPPSLGPCPGRQHMKTRRANPRTPEQLSPPGSVPEEEQSSPPSSGNTPAETSASTASEPSPRTEDDRPQDDDAYPPWFRVRVAFAAMVNGQTAPQIAERYNISPRLVEKWKRRLSREMRLAAGGG